MTIQDIYKLLIETLTKLEDENIDDISKIDLEILVKQLKKQILFGAFDPLKELNSVTIADCSALEDLVKQVDIEIKKESSRVQLVSKIVATAKIGLKAAGLPIPS